jgi:3-hydroxybutyryl-CoA dehydrogenase
MTAVGVIGAGVMGAGIAQLAAMRGCTVALLDVNADIVRKALEGIGRRLDQLVEKGKLPPVERDQIGRRCRPAAGPAEVAACELVIEAVSENLDLKRRVLAPVLALAGAETIFASNTSSLSITRLGRALGAGRRLAGMHFFNPAPLMPLVEVIAGADTDPAVADRLAAYARDWAKTVVRARDTPGFIVNRVARGYYLEALRMLGEGVAGVEQIDRALRQVGGFRLGPFELMDLVGIDINYTVSVSVWEQLGKPARLQPHPIQADLYRRGQLGRKTGRGFYVYGQGPPMPAVPGELEPFQVPLPVLEALGPFVAGATAHPGAEVEDYIFARTLAAVINEAFIAHEDGVATAEDIDTAMRLGTNYPQGPLAWAEQIVRGVCANLLTALNRAAGDDRFRPARSLTGPVGQDSNPV